MKISKILLETILPISIGALLFISYFFITDKLSSKPELEDCESYELSSAVYLIFMFAIILITSIYEIVIGNWILRKNKLNLALNIFNKIVFATFFTGILVVMQFINTKTIEIETYGPVFLVMLLLGLVILALTKLFQKIFENKIVS